MKDARMTKKAETIGLLFMVLPSPQRMEYIERLLIL